MDILVFIGEAERINKNVGVIGELRADELDHFRDGLESVDLEAVGEEGAGIAAVIGATIDGDAGLSGLHGGFVEIPADGF